MDVKKNVNKVIRRNFICLNNESRITGNATKAPINKLTSGIVYMLSASFLGFILIGIIVKNIKHDKKSSVISLYILFISLSLNFFIIYFYHIEIL